MMSNTATIATAFQNMGFTQAKTMVKIDSYGTYSEIYWRGEFVLLTNGSFHKPILIFSSRTKPITTDSSFKLEWIKFS
jgi:hypothetical protein